MSLVSSRAVLLATLAFVAATTHASAQTPMPTEAPLPPNCSAVQQPFVGTICTPTGSGKHPAILLLGGSEGGDLMGRVLAPVVAAHGYIGVSVAYFGEPGLPKYLVDVPVETVGRALDAVLARPDVDAAHIGILGGSKGGELALLAASLYPQIDAVVADVPSPFAWAGLGASGLSTKCSWTQGGKELPCVAYSSGPAAQQVGYEYMHHEPLVIRPLYDESMQDTAAVHAAFFALEQIHGPVLCLSADDDQLWDSPAQCTLAMAYLAAHHHAYADRSVSYPNAGHTFLWAMNGPSSAITAIPLPGGSSMALGGTADGDAQAASQAWPLIWRFFAEAL